MLKPRVIPCLLIQNGGLVKTIKFKDPKYVGDPTNAVRIFNEKKADELIVLDIDATVKGKTPNYEQIAHLATECRMPLCYGGGIKSVEQASKIIQLGVEKVAMSSTAVSRPEVLEDISSEIGNQSVVVVLDVKKKFIGKDYNVWTHNGTLNTDKNILDVLSDVQKYGVGEIVINFIDQDGLMKGYQIDAIKKFKKYIDVPFTVMGGAGTLQDMGKVASNLGIIGLAAGSLFVFKGKYRAVLINYPTQQQKQELIY